MKPTPIKIEQTVWWKLIQQVDLGRFFAEEDTVTKAMLTFDPASVTHAIETAIRTASVFVLGQDAVPGLESAGDMGTIVLPPLPFPRCWIELMDFDDPGVTGWTANADGPPVVVIATIIFENIQGREWSIAFNCSEEGGRFQDLRLIAYNIKVDEDGCTIRPMVGDPQVRSSDFVMVRRAVSLIHFLVAQGVRRDPAPISRQARRSFERRYKFRHPQVYRVEIDPTAPRDHGDGIREFHVRWMVRGHWRHYNSGLTTWIDPYIKGPPGAPWKGRPVYVR